MAPKTPRSGVTAHLPQSRERRVKARCSMRVGGSVRSLADQAIIHSSNDSICNCSSPYAIAVTRPLADRRVRALCMPPRCTYAARARDKESNIPRVLSYKRSDSSFFRLASLCKAGLSNGGCETVSPSVAFMAQTNTVRSERWPKTLHATCRYSRTQFRCSFSPLSGFR